MEQRERTVGVQRLAAYSNSLLDCQHSYYVACVSTLSEGYPSTLHNVVHSLIITQTLLETHIYVPSFFLSVALSAEAGARPSTMYQGHYSHPSVDCLTPFDYSSMHTPHKASGVQINKYIAYVRIKGMYIKKSIASSRFYLTTIRPQIVFVCLSVSFLYPILRVSTHTFI
jgi:hypothetical protein